MEGILGRKSKISESIIKDVNANSPARYNADKKRLYEASGCAGKLAVFAVRLDTFEKEKNEITFYLSTNSPNDLSIFRRKVLQEVKELPIYAEYIHRDAYNISKKYGKDAFLLIYLLGSHAMPFFTASRILACAAMALDPLFGLSNWGSSI